MLYQDTILDKLSPDPVLSKFRPAKIRRVLQIDIDDSSVFADVPYWDEKGADEDEED